jgi:hypothetical protein
MLKAENLNQALADISVIIPAYNRAALIGETLHSLLNQTVSAKEIIVVDDGSTDGTAEAALRYAAENGCLIAEDGGAAAAQPMAESEFRRTNSQNPNRHSLNDPLSAIRNPPSITVNPRLRVIKQANAGPGAARNRGLAEATGEFIHFFDSDDIAAPNKHEVQLRALLETGADIAYGQWCKGRFVNLTTEDTENTEEKAVLRLASQAGAAFSNPSTSELVRDSENTSLTRSASGPALARIAPEDRRLKIEAGEANSPATSYSLPVTAPKALALDSGRSTLDSGPRNFVPEGPVLQARGLPEGDLVKALLTNWSIVPHACLFRRSILEKAGSFPEDIWVGEDQLLFLRCLLAGAKVVHTPGTMVYYRVGNDPGKLTATGAAQKRHARDWGRFLLSAKKEIEDRRSELGTTNHTNLHERGEAGLCLDKPSGAAFSNPFTSELARDSENTSPSRCASGPAEALSADNAGIGSAGGNQLADSKEVLEGQTQAGLQMDSQKLQSIRMANDTSASKGNSSSVYIREIRGSNFYILDASTTPSAWFGFRLRAYEAWRDLERFFPEGEGELKENLKRIFLEKRKFPKTEMLKYQAAGFLLRKLAGLKLRVLAYREHASFRCERPSLRAGQKIGPVK